jgi:hypothetical protein
MDWIEREYCQVRDRNGNPTTPVRTSDLGRVLVEIFYPINLRIAKEKSITLQHKSCKDMNLKAWSCIHNLMSHRAQRLVKQKKWQFLLHVACVTYFLVDSDTVHREIATALLKKQICAVPKCTFIPEKNIAVPMLTIDNSKQQY